MIFPDVTAVATVFVACARRGYWRRDPESNRADRICNPTCKPRKRAKLAESLGKVLFIGRTRYAVSLQSARFLPDSIAEVNTNETSIVGASVGASLAHEGRFYATHGLKARCAEGAV